MTDKERSEYQEEWRAQQDEMGTAAIILVAPLLVIMATLVVWALYGGT